MPSFVYNGTKTLPDGTIAVACGGRVFERSVAGAVECRRLKPREVVLATRAAALEDLDALPVTLGPARAYEVVRVAPATRVVVAADDRIALAAFRGERRCDGAPKWREVA